MQVQDSFEPAYSKEYAVTFSTLCENVTAEFISCCTSGEFRCIFITEVFVIRKCF